jgi:hypothetical protein
MARACSSSVLLNTGLDLKYMESEASELGARQALWSAIRSRISWIIIVALAMLTGLLTYRWFFVPSKG